MTYIDPELYLKSLGMERLEEGAQELILGEIIGCFGGCKTIWLPFGGKLLDESLQFLGFDVIRTKLLDIDTRIDGLYLGTPTIVNNVQLFEGQFEGSWSKEIERMTVRNFCKVAMNHGCKVVVTGLGSGDISWDERIEDMTVGTGLECRMVAYKNFGEFSDAIFCTEESRKSGE